MGYGGIHTTLHSQSEIFSVSIVDDFVSLRRISETIMDSNLVLDVICYTTLFHY
jgi:hypothetical protein